MKLYHGTNVDFQKIDFKNVNQIRISVEDSILPILSVRLLIWL